MWKIFITVEPLNNIIDNYDCNIRIGSLKL